MEEQKQATVRIKLFLSFSAAVLLTHVVLISVFRNRILSLFAEKNAANEVVREVTENVLFYNSLVVILEGIILAGVVYVITIPIERSVKKIIETISEYQKGHWDKKCGLQSTDEFQVISDRLSAMASQIEKTTLSKNRLDLILNSLGDAVIILNQNGIVTWANEMMQKLSGYTSELLTGAHVSLFFVNKIPQHLSNEEYSILKPVEFLKLGIDLNNIRTLALHRNGAILPVLISCSTIHDVKTRESETIFLVRDISLLVQAEEEKKELSARMLSTSKMATLGEMASGIAHELNNPLTVINGFAGVLQDQVETNTVDVETLAVGLAQISKCVDRMSTIIKNLRNYSNSSERDPFKEVTFLEIFESSLGLCEQKYRAHQLKIYLDTYEPQLFIWGSKNQISQILISLIANSYDAIKDLNDKWVRISVQESDNYITLAISDSGLTPPSDICEKMFNPFFTTKISSESPGLGLSISSRLMNAHGGDLFIDKAAINTTIKMRFPKPRKRES